MFLSWISQLIRQAVLKGFSEAMDDLGLEAGTAPDALAAIKLRLAATAPAAIAQDAPELTEAGNGRRTRSRA